MITLPRTKKSQSHKVIEAEKNVKTAATFWAIVQTTHGLQTRTGAADEVQRQKSPTTPPRQAIHGDLVRRDIAPYGVLVGRETIALIPVEGYARPQAVTSIPEHTSTVESHRRKKNKPAVNRNVQ